MEHVSVTITRPDIAFAVNHVCKHLHALRRILRYVHLTISSGLHLRPNLLGVLNIRAKFRDEMILFMLCTKEKQCYEKIFHPNLSTDLLFLHRTTEILFHHRICHLYRKLVYTHHLKISEVFEMFFLIYWFGQEHVSSRVKVNFWFFRPNCGLGACQQAEAIVSGNIIKEECKTTTNATAELFWCTLKYSSSNP